MWLDWTISVSCNSCKLKKILLWVFPVCDFWVRSTERWSCRCPTETHHQGWSSSSSVPPINSSKKNKRQKKWMFLTDAFLHFLLCNFLEAHLPGDDSFFSFNMEQSLDIISIGFNVSHPCCHSTFLISKQNRCFTLFPTVFCLRFFHFSLTWFHV